MNYLHVKGWRTHQNYRKDRGTPPWIKVQRRLLTSAKWARLSDAQKGQILSIWLIAADREGAVPAPPNVLRKVCSLDDEPDVDLFLELGFLTDGCQPDDNQVTTTRQPDDRQLTGQEAEAETEKRQKDQKKGARKKKTASKRVWPQAADAFFAFCADNDVLDEAFDWFAVLKRKKAAMSELAFTRRLNKLQELSKQEPMQIILTRSADSGWSDLYPRNERRNESNGKHETPVQRREREAREALGIEDRT